MRQLISRGDWIAVALLLVLGGVMLNAVDFAGEYALNDDWGYSTPIYWWVETGRLYLTNWQSMPLVPQLIAGALWVEVFGLSQESLRGLTLTFALIACGSIYVIARQLRTPVSASFLCAVLPLASPIFFGLSYSFMTDIPATALALISLVFFIRYLSLVAPASANLWIAVLVLLLAVLLRQTTFGIALAFAIVFLATRGLTVRSLLVAVVVVVLPVVAYLAVTRFLQQETGLPLVYHEKSSGLIEFFGDLATANFGALRTSIGAFLRLSSFSGLFLLPVLPLLWSRLTAANWALALVGALVLTIASIALNAGVFAVRGDMLSSAGLGPRLIDGASPESPIFLAAAFTFVGHLIMLAALITVIAALMAKGHGRGHLETSHKPALALLGLSAIIGFGPHAAAYAAVFDRYTIFPAALFAIVTLRLIEVGETDRKRLRWAFGLAVALFCLSVSLTRDLFAWQDARYALISRLVENGVAAAQDIDGGFEYNNRNAIFDHPQEAVTMPLIDASTRSVFLSERPKATDEVLDQISVSKFLGLSKTTIFALQR